MPTIFLSVDVVAIAWVAMLRAQVVEITRERFCYSCRASFDVLCAPSRGRPQPMWVSGSEQFITRWNIARRGSTQKVPLRGCHRARKRQMSSPSVTTLEITPFVACDRPAILFAAVADLRFTRDEQLTILHHAGADHRSPHDFFDSLSSKRASKVPFLISYCSFRASTIFAVVSSSSASCPPMTGDSDAQQVLVIFRVQTCALGPLTQFLP